MIRKILSFLILTQATLACPAIPYSVKSVSGEFGISKSEAHALVAKSVSVWERRAGKKLFIRKPSGGVEINFLYTQTQARVDEAKLIEQEAREVKKQKEDLLSAQRTLKKELGESPVRKEFERRLEEYNSKMRLWNDGQVSSPEFFGQLQQEKTELMALREDLRKEREFLARYAEELKDNQSIVNNRIASTRSTIEDFNKRFANGQSFEQAGVYMEQGKSRKINIFLVEDREKVITVLAHELGHALGIGHVDDSSALMNPRISRENSGLQEVTDKDFVALSGVRCKEPFQ